jgi:hypothetical protein
MIRTYRAKVVTLVEKLLGETKRTYLSDSVERLMVSPETRQAFVTIGERTFGAVYESFEFEKGQSELMFEIHQCPDCGIVLENSQGLGSHRALMHPRPVQATVQAQAKGQVKR